ncbi:MAG TPA: hypothetical protein VNS11_01240 [Sphingomicrobium sp.]|nr:hypothetical protein [Sphingomicrobium sp.]
MNRIAMSAAASGLIRSLIGRAAVPRHRILLTDIRSIDWQSLTLMGERHEFQLRVTGADSAIVVERMCAGLDDAEFSISGQIVADIAIVGDPATNGDGSTSVSIEALTIAD